MKNIFLKNISQLNKIPNFEDEKQKQNKGEYILKIIIQQ